MSTYDLQLSKKLRASFKRFGRAGISQRVWDLVEEFNKAPSYFAAIKLAGKCRALALCSNDDCYWSEKATCAYHDEVAWVLSHCAEVTKDEKGDVASVTFRFTGGNDETKN